MAKDFFEENPDWDDLGNDYISGNKKGSKKGKTSKDEPGNGGVKNFFLKVFVEFEGNRYDFFELKSVEKDEAYNERESRLEYLIIFNRVAGIKSNTPFISFRFDSKAERDSKLKKLYEKMDEITMKIGGENFNE